MKVVKKCFIYIFSNWNQGEPDNFGTGEHCAALKTFKNPFVWSDRPCGIELYFVCQQDLDVVGGKRKARQSATKLCRTAPVFKCLLCGRAITNGCVV